MSNSDHTKKSGISEADRQLFRTTVKKIKAIPKKHHHPPETPDSLYTPDFRQRHAVSHPDFKPKLGAEERMRFSHAGIQTRVFNRLKRGSYPIEATLDLHGKTRIKAGIAMGSFLRITSHKMYQCVCIIHGKGLSNPQKNAVLKNYVNDYLKEHPIVKAFCSAKPQDGGNGAVYVLLKTSHQN